MSCSLIVPTLNEGNNVSRIYDVILDVFHEVNVDWELIFVDDDSTDNTLDEVMKLQSQAGNIRLIKSPNRNGLGHALSLGWKQAKLDYILFLDCDSHVPVNDLIALIEARSSNRVIIGSRYLSESRIYGASKTKVILSKVLNKIVGQMLKLNVRDISHSLRVFPNNYLQIDEVLTHPGYFWALSLKHQLLGYEFVEVPVNFYERQEGVTKNSSVKMMKSVLKTLNRLRNIKL